MSEYRKKAVVVNAIQWLAHDETPMFCVRAGGLHGLLGLITTLEGHMEVTPGDWIVTGVHGEKYPVKPNIFAETYEPVDTPDAAAMVEELVDALRQVINALRESSADRGLIIPHGDALGLGLTALSHVAAWRKGQPMPPYPLGHIDEHGAVVYEPVVPAEKAKTQLTPQEGAVDRLVARYGHVLRKASDGIQKDTVTLARLLMPLFGEPFIAPIFGDDEQKADALQLEWDNLHHLGIADGYLEIEVHDLGALGTVNPVFSKAKVQAEALREAAERPQFKGTYAETELQHIADALDPPKPVVVVVKHLLPDLSPPPAANSTEEN